MNIEEFVNDYLQEHRHDVLLNPHNGLVEFAEALKAEALKEAVEGVVVSELGAVSLPRCVYEKYAGRKVGIIIIGEDKRKE